MWITTSLSLLKRWTQTQFKKIILNSPSLANPSSQQQVRMSLRKALHPSLLPAHGDDGDDGDAGGPTDGDEPEEAEPGERPRAFTLRALLIGGLLSIGYAALVPFNDWMIGNTLLYNNYMPPAISLVLLAAGLIVNPLLGRRRLRMGEMGVIVIMLLGLGGVVSSGLARYFSTSVTKPAMLANEKSSYLKLYTHLSAADAEAAEEAHKQHYIKEFERLDRDGNGQLTGAELPSNSDAESLDQAAWLAWQLERNPPPEHGWVLPSSLFIGVPDAGPIDGNDPEFLYVIGKHYDGITDWKTNPKVDHRSRVTWVDAEGTRHSKQLVLGGMVRDHYETGTYLDLDDPQTGAALRGLAAGEQGAVDTGRRHTSAEGDTLNSLAEQFLGGADKAELLARANSMRSDQVAETLAVGTDLIIPSLVRVEEVISGGVPWDRWIEVGIAWSPLLIGAFLAMLALAAIVHRQWMHNERLPYPIAQVTLSMMEDPAKGRRFAAIYRSQAFWVGIATSVFILGLFGLSEYQILPLDVKMEARFDLHELKGKPWSDAYESKFIFGPKLFFTIVGLAFFLATDVSFSIWGFFALLNIVFMIAATQGVPINKNHVSQASLGGYAVMCLLILWIGRQYYGRLIAAAFGLGRAKNDPLIKKSAPYVWALLIGVGVMYAFFLLHGAAWLPALLYILIFLGIMLVLSRIVAESGIPFLQTPASVWVNAVQISLTGVTFPAAALMPLTYIGLTLMADTRESMMPYAVQAGYIGDKTGVPEHRSRVTFLSVAIIGGVIAISVMLLGSYLMPDRKDDGWAPTLADQAILPLVKGLNPETSIAREAAQQLTWIAYAVGAGITLLLGLGRLRFNWWPLHPIGFLVCSSYPGARIWFSVFLGWLAKVLVMRFGGTGMFNRLKPFAIGLIAGEVMLAGAFIFIKLIGLLIGEDLKAINVLPG